MIGLLEFMMRLTVICFPGPMYTSGYNADDVENKLLYRSVPVRAHLSSTVSQIIVATAAVMMRCLLV